MRIMTIKNYLDNPAGVGAASTPNRDLVRGDYQKRFEVLLRNKSDQFFGWTYKDREDYFIHVVVPSEDKERNNTYDVVIKFTPPDAQYSKNSSSIKDYNIQIFSNSPSFTYTYAYVFDKEKLLVPELKDKYKIETFDPPTTRNPYEGISYEKSTFMAIMYILINENTLLNKLALAKSSVGISRLRSIVRTTDKVSIEHAKERNRLKTEKVSVEVALKKEAKRKESITNPPKKGTKTNKTKPIQPRSKIKPKTKTRATTKSSQPNWKGR